MVPSEGWGGDPAERGESTSVSRCARSDGICPTRRHPDDEARPAAHTPAARTAGEGGSRRRVVPGEMRGKGAPADGVQEAAPTCGCHIERYRYHDTVPRRPVSVADDAEGTSAPGAEEAVRTCGHYTDTAPRRPTPSTVLGFKRGLQNKCDEMRVEVSRGGVPTDGFQESVARCGFRNPSLVRRCPMPPGRDTTRCAQMGAASSCVPVPTGARGGGGGRGHRDTHDDYAGTSRSRAAQLHAPTADLPAEMYDTGSIVGPSGSSTVNNVQVFAGYVLHIGSFMEGPDSKALSVGDEVKCKEVLGDLIDQKGSIVLPEKLRFDFSHGKPVQPEDLRKNESIVKQQIEAELEVSAQEIKLAKAKHINGLRAVFGEIYPDPVRVVSIGRKVEDVLANPESKEWLSISTELCGGTHFSNTRDAAAFALISEEDIAKGVRRITAVTAECASQAMKLASSIETDINEASKLDGATLEKVSLGGVNGNSTCRRTLINRVPSAVTGLNGSLSCGRVASASSFSSCAASVAKGGKSESFAASGLDYTDIPNAQIRKVTANRHLASKQTISHYYLTVDTCGDKLIKLRGELNPLQEASGGKKISINDLVVKGNIARWLKKEGDKVSLGGILCEAETEKVTAEMECMEEGYLAKIVQGDGAKEIKVEEHVLSVKMDINGENEISWEKEASEPSDFVCSDRGGCFGSKKGKLNYISKMNYYLRADCVSDIKAISDREARNRHSRYEVLKERCCDLAEMPALLSTCASIKISGADIVTQIFMDICGSTISLQKNLRKLDINLLSEAAFVKAGIKPRDFYSTYAGKVLEPNRLLSCYQIPRDSTIKLNTRLRGGCASYETWDDIIRAQQLYETVLLPPEHLVLPHPGGSAMQGTVLVKYLAEHMQFRSRKVLIQLCRKHYSGTSYGGNITSKNILFDPDGNVRINSAPETFSEHSAKSDYVAIGTILEDSFKDHVKNCYPMHLYQLVDFLRYGPVVDYKSEAVIAFVTNHPSLLSHFERIQISESLVQLIDRLHPAVVTVLLASLDQFVWRHTVKKVPAMKHTYTFHSWRNKAGKLCVPYADNGVSFLKFSNNFFKHHDWASLEQLDAAFSLVMEIKKFIPRCLFTILVTLKNSQNQYPALIQSFIDQVVRMLGNNVIDLKSRVMPV